MKFGVPWNIKGIRPDVRDSARQAARRSGMSVGEWLNHVIGEQAAFDDEDHADDGFHDGADERRQLKDSLSRIDRRLEQIIAQGRLNPPQPALSETPAYDPPPPPPLPSFAPPQSWTPPMAPAGDPWSNTIEQAIAEISARQHTLDTGIPAARPPAFVPPPVYQAPPYAAPFPPAPSPQASFLQSSSPVPPAAPAAPERAPIPRWPVQDLSGLESQLHHITQQIETLHQKNSTEDIAALRKELAEIGARLSEAMPQRAIEALEQEVRNLAQRIAETRQAPGIDPATINGMERGLAEVRDALRALRPAESLAGFEDAIRNLTYRIEQMGAGGQDPAFLQQLEAAITALRGIVSHVASNDSLGKLAEEMHGLSARIDQIATGSHGGQALAAVEQRIASLADQLRGGITVPALSPRLEELLDKFNDRMERNALTSGDQLALGSLEDRIVNLASKLDASDARLNQLGAIERGLADLLVRVEELRGTAGMGGIGGIGGGTGRPAAAVDHLKRDILRTQDSLEAVHGTVDAVVDRLAMIETERREHDAPRAPDHRSAPPPGASAPPPQPARAAPPPVRARAPIDPDLPPDYPLEPGSGIPRERGVSAADRIAASEAALEGARAPGTISSGSTNFIAAARRAAQAAAPEHDASGANARESGQDRSGKTLGQKVRSLLAGASVILIVAAGLHLAMTMLDPDNRSAVTASAPDAQQQAAQPEQIAETKETPAAPATVAAKEPEITPQTTIAVAQETLPEVTGSVPEQEPAATASLDLAAPDRLTPPEKFPAALRQAAAAGDPAAAYEVAMRYIDGEGVTRDLEEAAKWLSKSAETGLAPAQFRLGSLYEKGQGVKKSLETARQLYRAAADKGNAKAMHNLAVLYAEGNRGKPDYKTAAQWFRKAAERGVADSQYNLGILHARGIGVEQNLSESYKWFSLAANQGDKEAARKRDDVGGRLDADALMAARLAAKTFTARPQPAEATTVKAPEGGWDRATATVPAPAPKAAPVKKPRQVAPMRITPS